MKPVVVQTEECSPVPAAWLAERCELVVCPLGDDGLDEQLARAEGALVRTYTVVDDAFLDLAPALKVVARAGVGLDNIDVEACRARGVEVVHTPDANTQSVVEYVVALTMDAIRPRAFLDASMELDAWKRTRAEMSAPSQLADLTVGILGVGRIGSRVAQVMGVLGAGEVLGHDVRDVPVTHGAEMVDRDRLLAESDILTVHVDGRSDNRRLLGTEEFEKMKPGVVFINTSRGFVVDASSCAEFLDRHEGAMALLDVHDPEPFGDQYPLLRVPNAHLAPHLASCTVTAKENMSWVVRDLWAVLSGGKPVHPAPRFEGNARR
ncbi:MAG: NAD(P)-dependent oxidoreductase [Planctomycetota bacterium]